MIEERRNKKVRKDEIKNIENSIKLIKEHEYDEQYFYDTFKKFEKNYKSIKWENIKQEEV